MKKLSRVLVVLMLGGALWFWGRGDGAVRGGVVDGGAVARESQAAAPAVAMDLPALRAGEFGERAPVVEAAVGGDSESAAALVLRGLVLQAGESVVTIAGADVGLDFGGFGEAGIHARTTAGADGTFALELTAVPDVPELVRDDAILRVWARSEGFWPGSARVSLAEALAGDADVWVRLEPGATLTGRVVDESGQPLGGGYVTLQMSKEPLAAMGRDGRVDLKDLARNWSWSRAGCAEDGTFAVAVPDSDLVRLQVRATGFIGDGVDLASWDSVAHPDVGDIVLERGLAVGGRLVCAHGEPLEGVDLLAASVEANTRGGQSVDGAPTDASGRFVFGGFGRGAVAIREEGELLGECQAADLGVELVSKRRYLLVEVVDEAGRGLPGADLSTEIGVLTDGVFDDELVSSATAFGPTGRVVHVLTTEAWNHAELMAETSGGRSARLSIDLAADECMRKVRLVVLAVEPKE